jgi:hypothetical protein
MKISKYFILIAFFCFLFSMPSYAKYKSVFPKDNKCTEYSDFNAEYKQIVSEYYEVLHTVPKFSRQWNELKNKWQNKVFKAYKLKPGEDLDHPNISVKGSGNRYVLKEKLAYRKIDVKKTVGITVQEMAKKLATRVL